ncbi:hypothetical protein N7454_006363 [Penicillium verhagenii]|nr:hypothetical protein N7454_006363 [Penicillium verhagenii]
MTVEQPELPLPGMLIQRRADVSPTCFDVNDPGSPSFNIDGANLVGFHHGGVVPSLPLDFDGS